MKRLPTVRTAAWVLLFAALGASASAWFSPHPDLDADDAASVAVDAYAAAGFDATVDDTPELSGHVTSDGDAIDVWVVQAVIDGEQIESRVLTDGGQLVYVDDRIGADDTGRLLTDDQFLTIDDFRSDPTHGQWVARNLAALLAAVAVAGVCFVIAKRTDRLATTDVQRSSRFRPTRNTD